MIKVEINGKSLEFEDRSKLDAYLKEHDMELDVDGNILKNMNVGVIPKILDQWFAERVQYRQLASQYGKAGDKEKEAFYDRRQKRQKIFLNSVYGVLGLPIFRFYDRDNAEATTTSGQTIIRSAERMVNDVYLTKFKEKGVVPPTEDFVNYIDTDSLYLSSLPLAKLEDNVTDMTKFTIDLVTELTNKINRFYSYMVPRIFNVEPKLNRIKIVPDVIAKKALWMAKKRYAMLKVYDMEKLKAVKDKHGNEGKLEVKGIDVVRSSFPLAFQKFAGMILDQLLRDVPRIVLDEKIMKFEEGIGSCEIYDLAKTTSVRFVSKNEKHKYNPKTRPPFQFIDGSPSQVKAALCYNDLLKVWNLEKTVEKIENGSKVKWIYLLPNDYFIEQIAMKADDTDPDQILDFITTHVDRNKMYNRELRSKLEDIWTVIGWPMPNRGSEIASKTFNFEEAW